MSSRSTSPDPLALPSSPFALRSPRKASVKPTLRRRINNVAGTYSSPAKSFVMDTGPAGDVSPWRIRVTVEAEPKDGGGKSPGPKRASSVAMTKTTTVPLKSGDGTSSSPTKEKRAVRKSETAGDDGKEVKRPQRKRKGTPMRRRVTTPMTGGDDVDGEMVMPVQLSPSKRQSTRSSRPKTLRDRPTERSRRLLKAREELDYALQDAVGNSDEGVRMSDAHGVGDGPGEMTVANEDFTMVSLETLQSMKNNTSLIDDSKMGDKSMSYWPSSPPQVQNPQPEQNAPHSGRGTKVRYPDISLHAEQVRTTPAVASVYDAMSWKPTGPVIIVSPQSTSENSQGQAHQRQHQHLNHEPIEWRREREAVSRAINNSSPDKVITISEDNNTDDGEGAEDERQTHRDADNQDNDDIWAEEASRSLNEEQQQGQPDSRPPSPRDLNALFANQPLHPPRPKIPRTWRRSSGVEFSYVDSPAHGNGVASPGRKASATSTDGERGGGAGGSRSDGVLTPPSSDDTPEETEGEDEDMNLTRPDAAGTLLHAQELTARSSPGAASSPSSSTGGDGGSSSRLARRGDRTTSPAREDDTGLFWRPEQRGVSYSSRRREWFRRETPRAMDLSELLAREHDAARGELDVVKSSGKKGTGSVTNSTMLKPSVLVEKTESDVCESFQSKASDQRQLLHEMSSAPTGDDNQHRDFESEQESEQESEKESEQDSEQNGSVLDSEMTEGDEDIEIPEEDEWGDEDDEADVVEPSRSYEENLNLESPQKIRVNFNDSEGNSTLLAPKREYRSLFSRPEAAVSQASQPVIISDCKIEAHASAEPGLIARLSSALWSTIVRPSGPTAIHAPINSQEQEQVWEPPPFSPSLRAHIRSRYGVVSDQHPWTMTHMRTLHRMLNSLTSGRSDSIIPTTGPLPPGLEKFIGTDQIPVSISPHQFRWQVTRPEAYVALAFLQVLVPARLVQAMERGEVEWLGDSEAVRYRGWMGDRHGAHGPWDRSKKSVVLPRQGSRIDMEFVLLAVGNCAFANAEFESRSLGK